jgi:hypothetical protein
MSDMLIQAVPVMADLWLDFLKLVLAIYRLFGH